jgi:hypothetical protein
MASSAYPALAYADWAATCDTLHAHTQVLGKLAATLAPVEPQLQHDLGVYVLDWEDVRTSDDPHGFALEFARSAFRHACLVCGWDEGLAASAEGAPPPVK